METKTNNIMTTNSFIFSQVEIAQERKYIIDMVNTLAQDILDNMEEDQAPLTFIDSQDFEDGLMRDIQDYIYDKLMFGSTQGQIISDLHYTISDQCMITEIRDKEDMAAVMMYGLVEEHLSTISEGIKLEIKHLA